jgi:hypothetical protein
MSVLVYAISTDDARAPAAPELDEICAAGLRALAEPVQASPRADLEQLVRYEETVETIMRSHTILPMRFGSVLDDAEKVRQLLRARAGEFLAALEHLAGAVEYGLRASVAPGPAELPDLAGGGPGESYMRDRLAQRRRRKQICSWLDQELDGLSRERSYRATPAADGVLSAAYLVDRLAEQDFRQRLRELSESSGQILWWSGPWPPYSFAASVHG